MKKLLAIPAITIAALLAFPVIAWAHTAIVTGVAQCITSSTTADYGITWTITNQYSLNETAMVTSVTPNVIISIPKNSSRTYLQTVPVSTTNPATIAVHNVWSDNFTENITGDVSLPTGCVIPPTPTTIPPVTTTIPQVPITTIPVVPTTVPAVPVTVPAPVATVVPVANVPTVHKTVKPKRKPKPAVKPVPKPAVVVIPPTHTGEPWAGGDYWLIVGLAGGLGLGLLIRRKHVV